MDEFLKVVEAIKESHLKTAEIMENLEETIRNKNENGKIKKSATFSINLLSTLGTEELNKQRNLYRKMQLAADKLKFK